MPNSPATPQSAPAWTLLRDDDHGPEIGSDRYRRLFENALDGMLTTAPDGSFVAVNGAACRLLGHQDDAAFVASTPAVDALFESREAFARAMEAVRTDGAVHELETSLRTASGEPLAVSMNIVTAWRGGSFAGLDVAFADNTRQLAAEESNRSSTERLESAIAARTSQLERMVEELEAFCYSVSHDLRAPLRALGGFSRILIDEYAAGLPDDARRYLGRIEHNARFMSQLIDDLLHFSRLGRTPLDRRRVAMTTIAREAWELIGHEDGDRAIDIEIEPLPDAWGDVALLRQVFINLLSNAVKFTAVKPRARITVGATCGPEGTAYFVADDGVGFDMTYAGKLFTVFQRLHTDERFAGSGIGLANVRRIIERHDGSIHADAAPNQGARFTFVLGEENAK